MTQTPILWEITIVYPPPIIKYVTPHGSGDHTGRSWTNAYSFQEMLDNLSSNRDYYLTDSVFFADTILICGLSNISFIGKGKTKTIIQGDYVEQESPFDWSIEGFDLNDADSVTIRDMQIRRFRGFGIRVDAASSNFLAYNDSIDQCGWAAVVNGVQVIAAPCGVKLFGDDAIFRKSYITNSGWDGMQIAGYRTLVDSSVIYATGQARFVACDINTVVPRKSGIEAGWDSIHYNQGTAYLLEKPLVQTKDCILIGGKGIGVTQDTYPRIGNFYTKIENSRIQSLNPSHPTVRIDWADPMLFSWVKNNTFYSPVGYGPDCPVLEYYTDSTAVLYTNNTWIKADTLQSFCVKHNAE